MRTIGTYLKRLYGKLTAGTVTNAEAAAQLMVWGREMERRNTRKKRDPYKRHRRV